MPCFPIVAQRPPIDNDASASAAHYDAVTEELGFWPFRREQLLDELSSVGLPVETTNYEDTADSYLVVARRSH